jgi:SsrA-binding protein
MEKGNRKAENRRARFDVAVEETLEAGISLTGDEIKSIRSERVQLTGAYVKLLYGKNPQALPQVVVIGLHLGLAGEPERIRSLLLHAKEVRFLQEQLSVKGKTAVPLDLHMKRGWAKLTVGIGTGRKKGDKRNLLRERAVLRDQELVAKRGKY